MIQSNGACEELRPFPFYSLREFQVQELKSKSKYPVWIYTNIQTKIPYIIKEIPFDQRHLQALKELNKIRSANILPILGACLIKYKFGKIDNQRMRNENQKNNNETQSVLLFMEKCEMSLFQYVELRRKKMHPFKKDQINSFLMQMLAVLQKMQKEGIAHRDIKPQNILYNKGMYLLCDFDDVMLTKSTLFEYKLDVTTIQYSSPQFLKFLRKPKDKIFDPIRLDVYSLGLTLLFMCSMGRFSLQERLEYLYDDNSSHLEFMNEQRRKYIRQNPQYKSYNSFLKMMLEQDQYKRDDFITMLIKIKSKNGEDRDHSQFNMSDENESKSSAQLKKSKRKRQTNLLRRAQRQRKQTLVYSTLIVLMFVIFIFQCIY